MVVGWYFLDNENSFSSFSQQRYYEYYDLGKHEDGKITSAIDAAVTETYLVSMSRKYKVVVQPIVEDVLDKFVEEIKVDREEYKGPESGKPKIPTRWQLHKKRKEVFAEMQHEFVLKVQLISCLDEIMLSFLFTLSPVSQNGRGESQV